MKKAMVLLLGVCLGFSLAGCGGGYTTVKGTGYTYEVNNKWEKKGSEPYFSYFLEGEGEGKPRFFVMEETLSYSIAGTTLEEQYDLITRAHMTDYVGSDGISSTAFKNINKSTIGSYAFTTADIVTTGSNEVFYGRILCFFSGPKTAVVILFPPYSKNVFDKYKSDFDRLVKSVKLA